MLGHNQFIYCEDNPVMYVDEDGTRKVQYIAFGPSENDPTPPILEPEPVPDNMFDLAQYYVDEYSDDIVLRDEPIIENGVPYYTYDVAIPSRLFILPGHKQLSLLYAIALSEEIRRRSETDGYEHHKNMSVSHIYAELRVHIYGYIILRDERTRIANLNVDESRWYVLLAMAFYGYLGLEDYS